MILLLSYFPYFFKFLEGLRYTNYRVYDVNGFLSLRLTLFFFESLPDLLLQFLLKFPSSIWLNLLAEPMILKFAWVQFRDVFKIIRFPTEYHIRQQGVLACTNKWFSPGQIWIIQPHNKIILWFILIGNKFISKVGLCVLSFKALLELF